MKSITIALFFYLAGANVSGQAKTPSSEVTMQRALAEAANTHKNVFVIFHASWCGWCRKMDSAMDDKNLKAFFDSSYVIVRLTVDESKHKKELENPGAAELRKKYHGDKQGLPFWFILDSKGNFIADSRLKKSNIGTKPVNVGCPASNDEMNYFIKVIEMSSSLNKEQLTLVRDRFLNRP